MLTLGVSRGTIGGTMKVLVDLDEGLLQLVDAEASAAGATRLKVVRELLVEGLRARAAGRGEEFPEVEAWCPQDELVVALRTHECTDRCVPAAACGRASLTPGYAPCRRPQHDDGPCAHERAPQILSSCWISGQDMIGVDSSLREGTIIVSRPVRTAHEALTGKHASLLTVSSIASEAQTVAEERMRDRTAKPIT